MTCGIYMIQCSATDDLYIGSSVNIEIRWSKHLSDLVKNKHHNYRLQKVYNSFGFDMLKFTIIKECTKNSLIKLEQFYIDSLGPSLNLVRKLEPMTLKPTRKYTNILLVSPHGELITEIDNLNEFCRINNLSQAHMHQLLNDPKRSSNKCRGWELVEAII